MKTPPRDNHRYLMLVPFLLVTALIFLSCSAPVPRPTGVAYEYDGAKDMFKKGRFDRTLEFADGPTNASPPNVFTDRARILEVVLYSGLINGYKELIESYRKGADATKNARFKAEYERQRNDSLQYGSRLALGLGDVAHRITEGVRLSKEYTLEAPYPTAEGPLTLPQLAKVMDGGWIEPDEQEAVAKEAQLKGIDDALADIVGGDRSKARTALSAGPVKLDGVDVGLYLGKQLVVGATFFDRKHGRDSLKLRTLCGEADEAAKATLALLKESPNKDKEKAAKKLQDEIKSTLRNL
ncbi:MAG: hypothetical protein ABSG54_00520 [Terriglobia bacterium]